LLAKAGLVKAAQLWAGVIPLAWSWSQGRAARAAPALSDWQRCTSQPDQHRHRTARLPRRRGSCESV